MKTHLKFWKKIWKIVALIDKKNCKNHKKEKQ